MKIRNVLCCLVLICSMRFVEAAPGDLDPTFGTGGKVTYNFPSNRNDVVNTMFSQAGSYVAGGYTHDSAAILKFNNSGIASPQGPMIGFPGAVNGMASSADGNLHVAGSRTLGGSSVFAAYSAPFQHVIDELYPFFPGTGSAQAMGTMFIFESNGWGSIMASTKGVAVGYTETNGNYDFALVTARKEVIQTPIGSNNDVAYAIEINHNDDTILAGGFTLNAAGTAGDFALVRYDAHGVLDSGFGAGGKVITSIGSGFDEIRGMALQADGKIVVAGSTQVSGSNYDFVVARYTSAGILDTTFSSDGILLIPFTSGADSANAVKVFDNGKIIVAGSIGGNTGYGLAAINRDGTLDTTFSGDGKVTGTFGGAGGGVNALLLENATYTLPNRIVVGGFNFNGTNSDFALARFEGPPNPTLQFSSATYSAGEATVSALITVGLSAPSARTITVPFATGARDHGGFQGTANAGNDYISTNGSVVFNPGETNKTFSIVIKEDVLDEANETLNIYLRSAPDCILGSLSNALLTITDNDPTPTVQLDPANSYSFNENLGNASLSVRLSTASGQTVSVNYATTSGSALAGSDFTATSGTVPFSPGETVKNVLIPILDDAADEPVETFSFALSSATNATLATANATVTINDGDAPTVSFTSETLAVSENWGYYGVNVVLSFPATQTTTVNYATANLTASAGSDYTNTFGTLTFTTGESNKVIAVPIINDAVTEPNETFSIVLSNPAHAVLGTPSTTVVTIIDNSQPPAVSFRPMNLHTDGTFHIGEGGGAPSFVVELSKTYAQTVSVVVASSPITASVSDYNSSPQTLVFPTNGSGAKIYIIAPVQDSIYEGNETYRLTLTSVTNGIISGFTNFIVTIVDDEAAPQIAIIDPPFFIFGTTVNESSNLLTATVRRNSAVNVTSTANFSTEAITALPGIDYVPTNGTLTFGPGETNKTFSVQMLDNTVYETNKQFRLALSQPTNALLSGNILVNLVDNDPAPIVAFESSNFTVNEQAGLASVTVTLSAGSQAITTVNLAVTALTATANSDFIGTNLTLTFEPGELVREVTIPILFDGIREDNETIALTLSSPTNATVGASSTLTILDGNPLPLVSVEPSTYAIAESGGTFPLSVRLDTVTAQTVTVLYSTENQTASSNDYSVILGSLTFAPGETNKTIFVTVTNDSAVEMNETLRMVLTSPTNALLAANATVTILDDDAPIVKFTTNNFQVLESVGNANVSIALSEPSGRTISVQAFVANGIATAGIDYVIPGQTTLTFSPGETNKILVIPINEDSEEEPNETINLTLGNVTNAIVSGASIITIIDNDPPNVGFSANSYSVNEASGPGTVAVRLSYPSDQTVFVDYATENGTAEAGNDYVATSGTLIFAPGQTNKTFVVTLLNDSNVEGSETLHVVLSSFIAGNPGTATNAVLTVIDDEYAILSLERAGNSVVLSWTNSALGFALQSTTNLSTSWTNVTNSVTVTNGYNTAIISNLPNSQLFRLRR